VGQIDDIGIHYSHAAGLGHIAAEEFRMIAAKPLVLIADDDPVSRSFLRAAIERCGCTVLAVADAHSALRVLHSKAPALLLIDRRMPGMDGVALLRAARAQGIEAPAIATSAELDAQLIADLRAAGFATTLLKPASLAAIHGVLANFLADAILPVDTIVRADANEPTQLLDDTAALTAIGGDRDALRALRGMFARELDALSVELETAAAGSTADLGERLHRLRASCGFCGAAALGAAAWRLEHALRHGSSDIESAREALVDVCSATKRMLDGSP
jgi:CheY-like chemotaxis protein